MGKYIRPAFRDVELTPEEQEALRKKEELKDKRHQAYLRRKASGWQRQYEERTRAAKRAVRRSITFLSVRAMRENCLSGWLPSF